MKKPKNSKLILVVSVLIYALIFFSLLAIQSACIQGKLERLTASMLTIIMTFPSIIVICMLVRQTDISIQENDNGIDKALNENEEKILNFDEFCLVEFNKALSKREMEVAWLIYKGYNNKQIAEELYISETTVKKHITHIFEKTNLHDRKEYISMVNGNVEKN